MRRVAYRLGLTQPKSWAGPASGCKGPRKQRRWMGVPVVGGAQGSLSPGSKRPPVGYLNLWAKVRLTLQSHVRRTYQSELGEDPAIGQLTKESHTLGTQTGDATGTQNGGAWDPDR